MHYVPPKELPGCFGAERVRPKTPFAGGLRARWKAADGTIYEWDYLHGRVEKYDKRGNHQGEYDASTGSQITEPDSNKRVTP